MWGHVVAGRRYMPWLGAVWAWHMALNVAQACMSLARAAYAQVNMVLLDNLLSTVDAHVGCNVLLPLDMFQATSMLHFVETTPISVDCPHFCQATFILYPWHLCAQIQPCTPALSHMPCLRSLHMCMPMPCTFVPQSGRYV